MIVYVHIYIHIYIYIYMSSAQDYVLNLMPCTNLGSYPVGCDDFSIPGGITNGVSV